MIKLADLSTKSLSCISLHVPVGALATARFTSTSAKDEFMQVLLGHGLPRGGTVELLSKDIHSLPRAERIGLFTDIAVVWNHGGLISNLKLWENLCLPVCYHHNVQPSTLEEQAVEIFHKLGKPRKWLEERAARLPSSVPEHHAALFGLARAMLMAPGLVIYDTILEDLEPRTAALAADLIVQFHRALGNRTSLMLCTLPEHEASMPATLRFVQDGDNLIQREQ